MSAGDSSDSDDGKFDGTPPELRDIADNLRRDVIPAESKSQYAAEYSRFCEWRRNRSDIESTFLSNNLVTAYYAESQKRYKASSLFSKMAMLKKELYAREKFSMESACWSTCTQISRKSKRIQETKKAYVFEPEHLERFIMEGNSSPSLNLAVILAYHGALRPSELYNLKIEDCELKNNCNFIFTVRDRKTSHNGGMSAWTVSGAVQNWASPVPHWRQILTLRSEYSKREPLKEYVFLQVANNKIVNQRIGVHTLGDLSKKIGKINNLKIDPAKLTGYSFRRTSATALANSGASVHQLRQHLGHKSLGVATEYIDSSKSMQIQNSERLAGLTETSTRTLSALISTTSTENAKRSNSSSMPASLYFGSGAFANCSNLTLNISINGLPPDPSKENISAKKQRHE